MNYHRLSKLTTGSGFLSGKSVTFNPPPGAYSLGCRQSQCSGQRGSIISFQGDSYATIRFNRMDCLCNLAYCEG